MIDDVKLLNGANLAYVGDAYYELKIREYLLEKGITNQHKLHKEAVKYVCAKGHSLIVSKLEAMLTDEELTIYHRGRNHGYHLSRKNINLDEYLRSSGFEALIGYLYLTKNTNRLNEVIELAKAIIEGNDE